MENVEIHYRWDPPPWGYLSIEEQEQIEAQQRMKEYSKEKVFGEWDQSLNWVFSQIIYEQQEVHGEKRKAEIIHKAMPDMSSKVSYILASKITILTSNDLQF